MSTYPQTTMAKVPVGYILATTNAATGETRILERMDDEEFDRHTHYRVAELEDGVAVYREVGTGIIYLIPGDAPAWIKPDPVQRLLEGIH